MTAVNVVCQRLHNCIHVVTDGACYMPDGKLIGFGTKVYIEPLWPGVIAGRGSAIAIPLLGAALSLSFATFDDMIENIETVLEGMVAFYGIEGQAELVLAGFSQKRGGPESYLIETADVKPVGISAEAAEKAKSAGFLPEPFKLQKLPDFTVGPVPPDDLIGAANFEGINVDDDPAFVIAGLTKVIEMQRHSIYDDGICWIGGYAQLVTINADGIHQKILQRWPEDRIGELMKPTPVDWSAWSTAPSNVVQFNPRAAS